MGVFAAFLPTAGVFAIFDKLIKFERIMWVRIRPTRGLLFFSGFTAPLRRTSKSASACILLVERTKVAIQVRRL